MRGQGHGVRGNQVIFKTVIASTSGRVFLVVSREKFVVIKVDNTYLKIVGKSTSSCLVTIVTTVT